MNKLFSGISWVQDHISRPIQIAIYIVFAAALLGGIPFIIKSCNKETNYETIQANFIGEPVALHGDNYIIKVLNASTMEEIVVKEEAQFEDSIKKEGHFIAVTISIIQLGDSELKHCLDNNDFKLKDHTGTLVPLSDILSLIDVDSPDLRADSGDSVDSNSSFSTRKAVKDYSWQGMALSKYEETIITVFFEMDPTLNVEDTIMIFEADFYTGTGETRAATDVVLFERKSPIN